MTELITNSYIWFKVMEIKPAFSNMAEIGRKRQTGFTSFGNDLGLSSK